MGRWSPSSSASCSCRARRRARPGPRATSSRALLLAGCALLALAWAVANPPFAAPDEADHYVRALGLAQGHLIGAKAPGAVVGGTPRQQAWVRQLLRRVEVPSGLDPAPFNCVRADPRASAACEDAAHATTRRTAALTDVGPYQPLPYVVPGLAARLGHRATSADRRARLGGLAVNGALVVVATAFAGDAILGLALALTPMALFLMASTTSSGFEVAAGLAFAAAVIRVARGEQPSRRDRALLAVAGGALALSRTPGPLWVALDLALGAALAGPRAFGRRAGIISLAVIAAAVGLDRAWEAAHGPSAPIDLHGGAAEGVRQSLRAAPELVGRFGYLEWRLPAWTTAVWAVLLAALVVLALRAAARRERAVLAGALVAAVVLLPVFWLVALRGSGFALQGRHVLPALVALPLLAGELLRSRAIPRVAAWAAGAGVAVVQFAAFAYDARRAATGTDGPLLFLGGAEWSPPGGWVLWLAVAATGALGLCFSVARGGRTFRVAAAEPPRYPERPVSRLCAGAEPKQ